MVASIPPPDANWTNATLRNPVGPPYEPLPVLPQPCPRDPAQECPAFASYVNCTDNRGCHKDTVHYTSPTSCVINCLFPVLLPRLWDGVGIKAVDRLDLQSLLGGPNNTDKSLMPQLHPDCSGYAKIGKHVASQVFGAAA